MVSVEETLSNMSDIDYLHDEIQFDIDENLRIISIPPKGIVIGVCGDDDVNRINFRMPRYYNGFDMSTFKVVVNYMNAEGRANYYEVTDLTIDVDYILFAWLVNCDATYVVGEMLFSVKMVKIVNDRIKQKFHTTIGKGVILDGLKVDYVMPEQHWIGDYIATDAEASEFLGLPIEPDVSEADESYVSNYIATDDEATSYYNS